jgi:hypothetical protein
MTMNLNKHVGPRDIGIGLMSAAVQEIVRGTPITPLQKLPKHLEMPELHKIDPKPLIINAKSQQNQHLPSIYIGRGSPWGNPFVIGKHGNREEVCEKFRRHFIDRIVYGRGYEGRQILVDTVKSLRGQNLKCYCYPKQCHGMFLRDLANADDPIEFVRKEAARV